MANIVQVSLYIEKSQLNDMVELEGASHIPIQVHYRQAIRQYLGREMPKYRKNYALNNALKQIKQ